DLPANGRRNQKRGVMGILRVISCCVGYHAGWRGGGMPHSRLEHSRCWRSRRLLEIDRFEQLPKSGGFQRQPDMRWNVGQANFHAPPAQPPAIRDQVVQGHGGHECQPGQVHDNEPIRAQRNLQKLEDDLGLIEASLAFDGYDQKIWPTFDLEGQVAYGLPSRGYWLDRHGILLSKQLGLRIT